VADRRIPVIRTKAIQISSPGFTRKGIFGLSAPKTPSQLNRILVIRFGRLGDVVLLTPALHALRLGFPAARIDVLVDERYSPILSMCPAVSRVIPINRLNMRDGSKLRACWNILQLASALRSELYDLVLDCHSFRETHLLTWYSQAGRRLGLKRAYSTYLPFCFNMNPVLEDESLHVSDLFLSMLRPLGIDPSSTVPELKVPADEVAKAQDFLRGHRISGETLLVGLNVGAGSLSRTWPAERFARLAARILDYRTAARIVVFSPPGVDPLGGQLFARLKSDKILLAPILPLMEFAAMMSRCSLLVSNDTGPMHLGAAVGAPTLGLFSAGRPDQYRPLGTQCRWVRRVPIEELEVEEVWALVSGMLESIESGRAAQGRLYAGWQRS